MKSVIGVGPLYICVWTDILTIQNHWFMILEISQWLSNKLSPLSFVNFISSSVVHSEVSLLRISAFSVSGIVLVRPIMSTEGLSQNPSAFTELHWYEIPYV